MSSVINSFSQAVTTTKSTDLFLEHRLRVVEDLWESVLRQECGQKMVDLLAHLRDLCSPEGQTTNDQVSTVVKLISQLDLNEAIRASRAYALYFQLINIIEQDYEQRQQLTRFDSHNDAERHNISLTQDEKVPVNSGLGADLLEKSWHSVQKGKSKGIFSELFPELYRLNVPPSKSSACSINLMSG